MRAIYRSALFPCLLLATVSLLSLLTRKLSAQQAEPPSIRTLEDSKMMLQESDDAFETDGEYSRYQRWEYRMTPRLLKGGFLPEPGILLEEMERYSASHPTSQ